MKIEKLLAKKTEELAEPVKEFMGTLALYEGEVEPEINKTCLEAYDNALKAVRNWLRVVSALELAVTDYMYSDSELHFPGGNIVVHSETKVTLLGGILERPNNYEFVVDDEESGAMDFLPEDADSFMSADVFIDKPHGERVDTPIGQLSVGMLRLIMEIEDNPVKMLYLHLGDLLHAIRNMLSLPLHSDTSMVEAWEKLGARCKDASESTMLTDVFLKEHGIQDVIGVHKFETLLYDIDKFFERFSV